jgi:hypothetical protein
MFKKYFLELKCQQDVISPFLSAKTKHDTPLKSSTLKITPPKKIATVFSVILLAFNHSLISYKDFEFQNQT